MNVSRKLAYNKKEEHLILQVNVASIIELGTQSKIRHSNTSVYFFIANTNKVESNKMMQINFKTFKIKVLIFILIYLLSILRLEATLTLNVPKQL